MGLDLALLPVESITAHYSHTVLDCMRREDLFEVIKELEREYGIKVNDDFYSFLSKEGPPDMETHYGLTVETPYGKPVKSVPVFRLKGLYNHGDVRDNHRNQAVWAYLDMLPDDTAVALYWN